MIRLRRLTAVALVCFPVALTLLAGGSPSAQPIGTFRWQTAPHCNVVALTVVQVGGVFQLAGSDDQCGAGPAPVSGTATIGAADVRFGFTVTSASGRPTHVTALISLATLDGAWVTADSLGGPFRFNPAAVSGSPRPAPTHRVLSAVISINGLLTRGIGAVAVVRNGFVYEVTFDRDISQCAAVASVATTGGFTGVYASTSYSAALPRAVRVVGFTDAGTQASAPFHVVVACP